MNPVEILDIGEVIERSGLPASTLRFYEEKGLIQSVGRNGLRRLFDSDVLQRLALVSLGRNAGFSLGEIAGMFTPGGPKINQEQLVAKAIEIDKKIKKLVAVRDGLRHAADCPASNHLECPTFQKLLRVAGKKQGKHRNRSIGKAH